ncbi:UNVERIFIED_CONTAM: hypothetical protein FKN15_019753 [Acipenser sinensis]
MFSARRSVHRRLVHAPRRSTLGARTSTLRRSTLGASTLGARTSTLDASALDARRIDASTLGACTLTLDASAHRRSVHAPRRSTLRRSTLSASTPRRSVHAPRRSVHVIPMRTAGRGKRWVTTPLPQGRLLSEAGLASFPPVDGAFAALVKTPTLSGLDKDPACPNKQCRTTEIHLKKGYVWDIDAISRDASEGEPLLEEDSPGTDLASQHSEHDSESEALDTSDALWSLVERATRHLGIEWQAVELPRRSLFESPSVRSPLPRMLPAFPDFIKEGASEAGLASFPPVDAAFAALVKTPTLLGLVKDPACPNKQCRTTEIHLKKGYLAATEAVKLSNVASLLTVYQASLVKDLPEHLSASLRAELALIAQFLVKIAQLNARAQGRSIASLVVARRQLWLSQVRVEEPDKAPLLDAPITPGHTFGPAVEEMLQRSVRAREASQQMAKMWPHKPFQPRHHQEHQWHRAPPQRQPRPGGTKTSPSATAMYQASLVKDLPEHLSASLRAELALVAQFLVKIAQLNARAQGRSISSLVVARRQLWLSQARVQEPDKAPFPRLNTPSRAQRSKKPPGATAHPPAPHTLHAAPPQPPRTWPVSPRPPPARPNAPQQQLSYAAALAQPPPHAPNELGEIRQLLSMLCSRLLN